MCSTASLLFLQMLLCCSSVTPSNSLSLTPPLEASRNSLPLSSFKGKNCHQYRPYEFHIAPMQCYTNYPLRYFFNLLSPSSIVWTEMEKVGDIMKESTSSSNKDQSILNAWIKRLGQPQTDGNNSDNTMNSNLVLQLGSNNPHELKRCIQETLRHYGSSAFKGINLNCGCPSIESGGSASFGARLMNDAELTGRLVSAMKEGITADESNHIEISVKCRIGVVDNADELLLNISGEKNTFTEEKYKYLHNYISTIRNAGADHVILHARNAVLSGLSPVKNRIVPELHYDIVERIASDFDFGKKDDGLKVTLNGGIKSLGQLKDLMETCGSGHGGTSSDVSGHMAGRWILRRPLDLIGVEELLLQEQWRWQQLNRQSDDDEGQHAYTAHGEPPEYGNNQAIRAVEKYMDFAFSMINERTGKSQHTAADLFLPLFLVVEQLKEDYDMRISNYDDDIEENENDDMITASSTEPLLLSIEEIEHIHKILRDGMNDMQSSNKSKGGKKKKKAYLQAADDEINFKRLSSSFKTLVGTKVANKWKRNRSEL